MRLKGIFQRKNEMINGMQDICPNHITKQYKSVMKRSGVLIACMILWLPVGLFVSIPFFENAELLAAILVIPEVIFYLVLVFVIWRCPACGHRVYFRMKWGIFGDTCPYCHVDWKKDNQSVEKVGG